MTYFLTTPPLRARWLAAVAPLLACILLATAAHAQDASQFINRWKTGERIALNGSTPVADGSAQNEWVVERVDRTYVRLKNRATEAYLHTENGLGAGPADAGWWSAMWELEPVGDYVRIKNRWKGTYLHNQNGSLEVGEIEDGWWSAMWTRQTTASSGQNAPSYSEAEPEVTPATAPSSGSAGSQSAASGGRQVELAREMFSGMARAELDEIDAPRQSLFESDPNPANHVNGMARIGDWFIVNYGFYAKDRGRILFWEQGQDDYEEHWYDIFGTGKPEHMGSARYYLAVATTDGTYIRFFDFSNPTSGIRELENARLTNGEGNLGFTYCPDRKRYYVLTGWGEMVLHESNAETLEATTYWREVGRFSVPTAEAGFPIVRRAQDEFVIVSLGAGSDGSKTPYGYRLTSMTLSGTPGATTVSASADATNYSLTEGEAGGAPSFRWGGTVLIEPGNLLAFYAAPKRLDASGNYYKWSASVSREPTRATDIYVTIDKVKCIKASEISGDEIYLGIYDREPTPSEIAMNQSNITKIPLGTGNSEALDNGESWYLSSRFRTTSKLTIDLWELDAGLDPNDHIDTLEIPVSKAFGTHTARLAGDGGVYEITYTVSAAP